MKCVMEILNKFCKMSGQEVSNEKTSILFSKNVDRNIRRRLVQLSGFRETDQLGKYLGVPLIGRAVRRNDFQYIIDQVSNKLGANDWWCEVMHGKYGCRALTGETNVQGTASSLWKYIVVFGLLAMGKRQMLGNMLGLTKV
ncbi:hypothetical protein TSUD_338860 [Trifolium subterraneum]|nr:hypothetical protein TSUD_338860 [Trifolium subterraneum]